MPTNNKYLIIDGVTYKVPIVSMQRKGDILDLEANRTEDGMLHREVIGTYYNFTINIGPISDRELYDRLWTVLTTPIASHMIQLPNQSEAFEGYFGSVQDNIVLVTDEGYKATGLSCNIVCTGPSIRANPRVHT